ncbi:MAG TPA: alpha/beta hydrolase [Vicinamibacterales bacterium]|jgi:acetyl esterase/lipase|nr:alpha/beta hydrolase [Vicinamibacterales bacterium]
MKVLVTLAVASSVVMYEAAAPQDASRPAPVPLWPGGAPGALGSSPEDTPTISLYRPTGTSTGAAFVVCPGGGYARLADHEGHDVAVWLNGIGVTAVVLKYRLGPRYRHPAPLQDVARAIRTVRARAKEWSIDPGRIGVIGFSAGGHLASTIATRFDAGNQGAADPIERLSNRPDVAVLAYPVISMDEGVTHAGSRSNLLGPTPSAELVQAMSTDRRVTARTPPSFLFHTADDAGVPVENSLRFAAALRSANVPYELHVFETGRHGVGLAPDNPVLSAWPRLLESWLRTRKFIK